MLQVEIASAAVAAAEAAASVLSKTYIGQEAVAGLLHCQVLIGSRR